MPEGPSLVILKEALAPFKGKKVTGVEGNTRILLPDIKGKKVTAIKTWGKELLICFPEFTIRVHFLLFGTYRINERKDMEPRLSLAFGKQEVNFYTSSIRILYEPPDDIYDWSADVMSPGWSHRKAMAKLRQIPDTLVCDAILNQRIFAGAGNIIKNEVLFRIRVHPATRVGQLPARKKSQLVKDVVDYSFLFLEWKKAFVLKKNWLIHTKRTCPRCHIPAHKEYLGKTARRTFFCNNCQVLYG
ncbi:DNA-formamidopyrimidine glycosylase family protein [Chitinophaga sp. 22620]|uniref:DNA-formamidopyrimidine glycosylase family protein n=1 Tax=Chitinophaga sp. 22620 TaxID=3453952 RepID=UPI003F87E06E